MPTGQPDTVATITTSYLDNTPNVYRLRYGPRDPLVGVAADLKSRRFIFDPAIKRVVIEDSTGIRKTLERQFFFSPPIETEIHPIVSASNGSIRFSFVGTNGRPVTISGL